MVLRGEENWEPQVDDRQIAARLSDTYLVADCAGDVSF